MNVKVVTKQTTLHLFGHLGGARAFIESQTQDWKEKPVITQSGRGFVLDATVFANVVIKLRWLEVK